MFLILLLLCLRVRTLGGGGGGREEGGGREISNIYLSLFMQIFEMMKASYEQRAVKKGSA